MSRADQIARQQRRAFSVLANSLPAEVTIGSTVYEVALVSGAATHEQDLGVRLTPESITFTLDKELYPTEPTLRAKVLYQSIPYYLDDVAGRGDLYQHWRCRAVRHLGR